MISKTSVLTLGISCLTTSNLPWFMDLTFQVPLQYCSVFTASDFTSITSHIQSWVVVLLWLRLFILSWVSSPLISSSLLGTYWPGDFIFQCPIFLSVHTVHGVLKTRILKWLAIPFSSGSILSELSAMTGPSWVALHSMVHDKAVVHVVSLVSFLWLWFSFCLPSDG